MHGDMQRCECFVFEQWIHEQLTDYRETIPELMDQKWAGRFETFRIPAEQQSSFVKWLSELVSFKLMRNHGLSMVEDLISSSEEREIFDSLLNHALKVSA